MTTWILLVSISLSTALAQIIMKYAAETSNQVGTFFNPRVLLLVMASFGISCIGQLIWLYTLRTASLSTSYLFLSVVFVLVPLAGWWFFGEHLSLLHILSMALILSGVAVMGYAGMGR